MAALEAVLADISSQGVPQIYCLGDVVGYGPQPVEAMTRVLDVCKPERCIMGNHDHAVIHEPVGFNRSARGAALWTNQVVQAGFMHLFGGKRRRWNWLRNLPLSFTEHGMMFVHASPRQPLEEYVLEEHTHGVSFTGEDPNRLLKENFDLLDRGCFIGHTHRPGVITSDDYRWHSLTDIDYRWTLDERQVIVNIGSVGQPRDRDPRACYVIFDGEEIFWRRVEYDIEATRALIKANPNLEDRLGDRLLEGR